jgi:anti-sigma factor RsiW
MEHTNAYQLIADYVLDLLPAEKRLLLESHAAACPACRQAIQQERQVGQVVRAAVWQMPRPAAARLNQLRPVVSRTRPFFFTMPRQVAALGLMVFLLLGTLGLNRVNQQSHWPVQSPTVLVVTETATATSAPTSTTMTVERTAFEGIGRPVTVATAGPAAVPNAAATPVMTLVSGY